MSASYQAIFPSLRTVAPASPPPPEWQAPASSSSGAAPTDDSFAHDMMEILNPLQHIPIVSVIYRRLTGDKIGPMERIAGDALYGGVIGLASSVANVAFEKLTGKDFGDTALAMLGMDQDKPTAVAAKATAVQTAASDVADAPPAQLIPIAAKPTSPVPTSTPALVQNSELAGIFNPKNVGPKNIGLDPNSDAAVKPLVPAPTKTSTLNDANAGALMESLNRDGIASDMGLRAMYAYRKSLALPVDAPTADTTVH
jgi:PPE-repeat protein